VSPVVRFFTSVKVAITLIIIIAIASIIGTLIPQGRSHQEYLLHYGQLAYLLEKLQLTRLYHSFWYLALLFLFSLNLIICTVVRLRPKLKRALRPFLDFKASDLMALHFHHQFNLNLPLASVQQRAKEILKDHHYHFLEKNDAKGVKIAARKRILGIFGSDIVHLAILIILAGGLLSGLGSFRTDLALHQKQIAAVPQADFSLRLDSFETEFYPNGQVKDWKSTLTVLEKDKEILSKTIEVNHPLNYRGFMFYQSAYGWDWDQASLEILIKQPGGQAEEKVVKIKVGEKMVLENGIEIEALRFLPDFVLDENRQPSTRSLEPNNPAALVKITRSGESLFSGWLFGRFPDFSSLHPGKSSALNLELKGYAGSQYSVIHVARDPGTRLIWVGCFLIMLGLGLAFYWPTYEIRIWLQEELGKTTIVAGGLANKNRENFAKELETIISFLRKKK